MGASGNVPATAVSIRDRLTGMSDELITSVVIGDQCHRSTAPLTHGYFLYTVVDLTNELELVVLNASAKADAPPADVARYAGSSDHFLFFASNLRGTRFLPCGQLYEFLRVVGSGAALERGRQIAQQLGTNAIPGFSYILAATLDETDLPGLEAFSTSAEYTVLTMQFMPIEVHGKTRYAPVKSGS